MISQKNNYNIRRSYVHLNEKSKGVEMFFPIGRLLSIHDRSYANLTEIE